MAKKKLTRIHERTEDIVHILPNGSHDPCTTLCGYVDVMEHEYTPTNKKVTCHVCQSEFDALKNGLVLVNI